MKKQILYIIGILLLFFISCNQKTAEKKAALYNALDEIDKNTEGFNPAYFNDSTGYIVIKAVYKNGAYIPDSVVAFKRNGKFPYRTEKTTSLPYVVSYYNANGALAGAYSIDNPVMSKSCEEGQQGIRVNENMPFEILLPNDKNITRYTISVQGKEVAGKNLPLRLIKEDTNYPAGNNDTLGGIRN
jgi:hypothetical protein